MTDLSLPLINHGASASELATANGLSPANPIHPSNMGTQVPGEEEDYTIKCICGFYDDDGNTVFCDRCETWQHTECYYFEDGEVPDVSGIDHWCVDCMPRRLDARGATERQTTRREQSDVGERKVKKAPTKSHKKKARAPEPSLSFAIGLPIYDRNDHHYGHDRTLGSPKDHFPSTKRPKITHRYSSSLQSPHLSYGGNDKRSGSVSRAIHSPSKTPGKRLTNGHSCDQYSLEFMRLYDDDPGDTTMQANLFNDITITSSLSLWRQDTEALAEASNGLSPPEIFYRCEQPLDSWGFPTLHKQYRQGDHANADGRYPRWTLLTTEAPLVKDTIVGELKGKVGHMRDYADDPANRWEYLRHPVPFVFFHPKLPIYIDTRREGTTCRYLRRSCRPNLNMTTILENGSDYRFCFVAKDDLEAGSELTVGWTLDQHIRNFLNSEHLKHEGNAEMDEDYVSDWVAKVLADFGGCACDSPAQCSMAKYDRRFTSSINGTFKLANGNAFKARNGYTKHHSPVVDHPANVKTNIVKQQEEEEDDRSTSGSLRSKHRSRDTTPTRNSAAENSFATGLELSDREKRKIAALEKNFEQIGQDKGQPPQKKKKRSSGGAAVQASATSGSRQQGHLPTVGQPNTPGNGPRPQYVDASTSRRTSGSPVGKQVDHPNPSHVKMAGRKRRAPPLSQPTPKAFTPLRPNYASIATQTDPDGYVDWYQEPVQSQPRKPYMSLSKQLLLRAQRGRFRMEQRILEETRQQELLTSSSQASSGEPTTLSQPVEDTEMQDVEQYIGRTAGTMPDNGSVQKPRPPDEQWTPNEGINPQIKPPPPPQVSNGQNMIGLRVQLPSPATQLNIDPFSSSPRDVAQSPVTARSPFNQNSGTYPPLFPTTGASIVQPSPVKKKVSLGEYMSRRREPSTVGEKPSHNSPVLPQGTAKSLESIGEGKARTEEGRALVSIPKRETGSPAEGKQE
ncbi:MAG: hypothetical protein Q9218_001012 [Villophora microphyllina]